MNVSALKAPSASLSQGLAVFATEMGAGAIPDSARRVMQLSVLDWIAVATAGVDEPVSRIVRQMVTEDGGAAQAGVFGLDRKLPTRAAALANGATSHALDYDDTHFAFYGHPTVTCVSAAFALAEKTGASEQSALDAALIGAEAACRIGRWLGLGHYQHGFHQTATAGTFGAALAASRVLGLDMDQTRHALGIAATRASGLKSQFGTMGKPYHAGMAAANGVEAAVLAATGFVSNPDGIDMAQGFAATHAGDGLVDPLDQLGQAWLFEAVQHKFHACCHGTHATLEALAELRDQHGVTPEDVETVTVTVHPMFLKVCNISEPATGLEAKFSLRLTAAMALAGQDTASLASFTDAICADPRMTALRDRVTVSTDDARPETVASVEVTLASGGKAQASHDINGQLPLETRERKVRQKASALLGEAYAEACWARIAAMPDSDRTLTLAGLVRA